MIQMSCLRHWFVSGLLLTTLYGTVSAEQFDVAAYVQKVQQAFQVPGVAIGIVQDGQMVYQQGFGVTDLDMPRPVDPQTIFKIASNTKAFTAAALAKLVDQGKISWDDKVQQHLPDFQLYDDYASAEFTIIDLMTHRSGLGLGAGDLMLWPEPTRFTRAEVVQNLRYLKPVHGFRSTYAYDNTLYIVAGQVIAAVSGVSWENYISQHIFKPLGLERCYSGGIDTTVNKNITAPHIIIDGENKVDQPNRIANRTSLMAAAGGIKCSVQDLQVWVKTLLGNGKMPNGKRLYSQRQARKMWTAVTPLRVYEADRGRDKTNYRAYALGWRLKDYQGHWQVSHTGTLSGTMSEITLYPNEGFGLIVLLNKSSGYARAALTRGIVQEYLDMPRRDWLDYYLTHQTERQARQAEAGSQNPDLGLPDERNVRSDPLWQQRLGSYTDPWFGEIRLLQQDDKIQFRASKSPRLTGQIFAHNESTWWVKWDNRSFGADAWLHFDEQGGRLLRMTRIMADSDWSFNFQDLLLTQQQEGQ